MRGKIRACIMDRVSDLRSKADQLEGMVAELDGLESKIQCYERECERSRMEIHELRKKCSELSDGLDKSRAEYEKRISDSEYTINKLKEMKDGYALESRTMRDVLCRMMETLGSIYTGSLNDEPSSENLNYIEQLKKNLELEGVHLIYHPPHSKIEDCSIDEVIDIETEDCNLDGCAARTHRFGLVYDNLEERTFIQESVYVYRCKTNTYGQSESAIDEKKEDDQNQLYDSDIDHTSYFGSEDKSIHPGGKLMEPSDGGEDDDCSAGKDDVTKRTGAEENSDDDQDCGFEPRKITYQLGKLSCQSESEFGRYTALYQDEKLVVILITGYDESDKDPSVLNARWNEIRLEEAVLKIIQENDGGITKTDIRNMFNNDNNLDSWIKSLYTQKKGVKNILKGDLYQLIDNVLNELNSSSKIHQRGKRWHLNE